MVFPRFFLGLPNIFQNAGKTRHGYERSKKNSERNRQSGMENS